MTEVDIVCRWAHNAITKISHRAQEVSVGLLIRSLEWADSGSG